VSDQVVELDRETIARVLVEQRCRDCGTWLTGGEVGHTSLERLVSGQMICRGRGAGRRRTSVLVASPTERQRDQIVRWYNGRAEWHPGVRWRRPTVAERRRALALAEVA
jgi:hypothetical protein